MLPTVSWRVRRGGTVEDRRGEVVGFYAVQVQAGIDRDRLARRGGGLRRGCPSSAAALREIVNVALWARRFPRDGDLDVALGAADVGGVVGVHASCRR